MKTIPANQLKIKGIQSISEALSQEGEVMITVRGEGRYVVVDLPTYNRLRECELEAALQESRREVAEGKYVVESVEEHVKRLLKAAE